MASQDEAPAAVRSVLRDRPRPRAETTRWAHHVADLNSGEVHTTELDRPLTSQSRVEHLLRLSSIRNIIFGAPLCTLTTRTPYLASPEAWVDATIDYFNPRVGMQWTPQQHPGDVRNLSCYFSQMPAERSLVTISLTAAAVHPVGGHVSLGWVPLDQGGPVEGLVRFPIAGPDRDYVLDITFDRGSMDPPEFVMTLESGIEWMLFHAATLRTPPLVLVSDPSVPGPGPS